MNEESEKLLQLAGNANDGRKEIDGFIFICKPFGFSEAARIQLRIIKIVGPGLAALIGGDNKNILDYDINSKSISNGLHSLLMQVDEKILMELLGRVFNRTSVIIHGEAKLLSNNGVINEETANLIFTRNITRMYKVFSFVLQENYPDFFSKVASIGSLMKKTGILGQQTKSSKRK